MKITPSIIRGKKFSSSLRGYNKSEVQNFLNLLADLCENLVQKNKKLSEENKKLEKELEKYRSREKILRNADNILQESREKAKLIVKEAEIKAEKIIEMSNRKLADLKQEIKRLSAQKKLFLTKLKSLLRSHEELLKFYEEGDLSPDKSSPPPPSPLLYKIPSSKKKILFEED